MALEVALFLLLVLVYFSLQASHMTLIHAIATVSVHCVHSVIMLKFIVYPKDVQRCTAAVVSATAGHAKTDMSASMAVIENFFDSDHW